MLFTLQIFKIQNNFCDVAGQSWRLQQVPYGRRKIKPQKKNYFTKILTSTF